MVELKSDGPMTRHDVASFLRRFAAEIDGPETRSQSTDVEMDAHERDQAQASQEGASHPQSISQSGPTTQASQSTVTQEQEQRDAPAQSEPATDEGDREHREHEERITFIIGGDSATVTMPETLDFEVEVESSSSMFGSDVSQDITMTLSWDIDEPDRGLGTYDIDIE